MKKLVIVFVIAISAGLLTGCSDEDVLPADGDGSVEIIDGRR